MIASPTATLRLTASRGQPDCLVSCSCGNEYLTSRPFTVDCDACGKPVAPRRIPIQRIESERARQPWPIDELGLRDTVIKAMADFIKSDFIIKQSDNETLCERYIKQNDAIAMGWKVFYATMRFVRPHLSTKPPRDMGMVLNLWVGYNKAVINYINAERHSKARGLAGASMLDYEKQMNDILSALDDVKEGE